MQVPHYTLLVSWTMCTLCTHRPIYQLSHIDQRIGRASFDTSTNTWPIYRSKGAQNTHDPVSWQYTKQTKTFQLAKLILVVPNSPNLTEDDWRGVSSFFIHLKESISFPKSWHYWDKKYHIYSPLKMTGRVYRHLNMNNLLIPGEAMTILEKTTLAMAFLAAAWKKDI